MACQKCNTLQASVPFWRFFLSSKLRSRKVQVFYASTPRSIGGPQQAVGSHMTTSSVSPFSSGKYECNTLLNIQSPPGYDGCSLIWQNRVFLVVTVYVGWKEQTLIISLALHGSGHASSFIWGSRLLVKPLMCLITSNIQELTTSFILFFSLPLSSLQF